MARPKKAAPARPTAAAETLGPRPTALTIKGSLAWRGWVERGAKHCRTDVAKLVDAALLHYLKSQGFAEAPPER